MPDPEMFLVPNVNEAIITSPRVRMENTAWIYLAPNYALKRTFSTVWDDLRVNFTTSLENAEYNGFSESSAASLAFNSTSAEV